MQVKDVIDGTVEIQIEVKLQNLIELGIRLGNIEGLNNEDMRILMKGYVESHKQDMITKLGTALKHNIPEFNRLCAFCEGELDCESDHK